MTPKCPDCKRDQDDCICASPASAQEGWKLVGLEDLIKTVLDADAALSSGDKNEALIGVRVAASFVSLIKSHVANRKTLTAPTPPSTEDQRDAERLNWLDEQGMIAIGHKGCGEYRYYAGDLFPAIRQVIDQAIQEDKP